MGIFEYTDLMDIGLPNLLFINCNYAILCCYIDLYCNSLKKHVFLLCITNYSFFFFKSVFSMVLGSLCWCQRNLFHLVLMDNACLKRFWNFKTQHLGKHILIKFLIWKWIKCIFVLTICIKKMPGVRSIAMKSIRITILAS